MVLERTKAIVLVDILYCQRRFSVKEKDMAMLSIESYFNRYTGDLPGSKEFRRVYDFCIEHIIPHAGKSKLVKIVFSKVN